MGGQEASHKSSENYKEKVIELLDSDGYILVGNSSRMGMISDLIFKKPITEGDTELVVETKYADVSLSDADLRTELVRYFLLYMNKRDDPFDFYLFIRKCRNWNKWRKIFDPAIYNENDARSYFNKITHKTKLTKPELDKFVSYCFEHFEVFLSDTYIHQVNYDGLIMKIDELKNDKFIDSGMDFYLRELKPIVSRNELTYNIVELEKMPEEIYLYETSFDMQYLYKEIPYYVPIWFKDGLMYSLFVFDEEYEKYVSKKEYETIKMDKFLIDDRNLYLVQILIKKLILNIGVNKGCNYVKYKGDLLFFEQRDLSKDNLLKDGKQVCRYFKDASTPFIKHKAIRVDTKYVDRSYLIYLTPIVLFTNDGVNLITGEDVIKLHQLFSPNKYDTNKSILGDLKWWSKLIFKKGKNEDISVSALIKTIVTIRPPLNSKERNNQVFTKTLEGVSNV